MKRDIITIGASAGGVEALTQIVSKLPPTYPGTLFVTLHVSPSFPSKLPEILSRRSTLPAVHPADGERVRRGRIYVAPPDHHLLVERDVVRLYHGPSENRSRPAIDPLFRSAAESYSERVVGVLLSGMLYDGAAGLITIQRFGGVTIVQDPEEAAFTSMPLTAITRQQPDYILPLAQIGPTLLRLAQCETP